MPVRTYEFFLILAIISTLQEKYFVTEETFPQMKRLNISGLEDLQLYITLTTIGSVCSLNFRFFNFF